MGDLNCASSFKSKLIIDPFQQGELFWDKYKGSKSDIRYAMSQINASLMTPQANLQIQETEVKPDSIQPPKSELESRATVPSIRMRATRGRSPHYYFLEEELKMERERQYIEQTKDVRLQLETIEQVDKLQLKVMHDTLLRLNGPTWYQEPSRKQKTCAENLGDALALDRKQLCISHTNQILWDMGLVPLPDKRVVWRAIKYAEDDPVEFLLGLFKINKVLSEVQIKKNFYTINDRIILSALAHLALESTLKEMHIRIPSPPPAEKKPPPKQKKEKKVVLESPYLQTLSVDPNLLKPKKHKKIDTSIHPNSPYFAYTKELKRLQLSNQLPEKQEYKYKYKIEELDTIIIKLSPSPISSGRASHASSSTVGTYGPLSNFDNRKRKLVQKSLKDALGYHNQVLKKASKSALASPSIMSTKSGKSKKRRQRYVQTECKFDDLEGKPTHIVMGGLKITKTGDLVPYIQGVSRMDYNRRSYRYIYGGIATLPDGTTIRIISGIAYKPIPFYSTVIHAGITCKEEGDPIPLIAGISSKQYPKHEEPPALPKTLDAKPYCQCVDVYNQYVKIKEAHHAECLKMYRQYHLTRQKKVLKANPELTYVVGGVHNTKDGPVYILSGIRPPVDQWYKPVVAGVSMKGEEPTFIISGMQATKLYDEYLKSVELNLKIMPNTSLIVGGVSTTEDGVPNIVVQGVSVQRPEPRKLEYKLEGICPEKNTVVVCDEGVPDPWLQNSYSTLISGVSSEHAQPVHILDGEEQSNRSLTYIFGGVKERPGHKPLIVISGVQGEPLKEEIIDPKCQYLIGGVKPQPDGTNILMVQGVVIERENIPQRCTYVIAGIKQLPDGTTVPIIQTCVPVKPIQCDCMDVYRKYMEMQETKHGKCLEMYRKYMRKMEKEEQERCKLKRPKTTYIIDGVFGANTNEPKLIIAGVATEKILDACYGYMGMEPLTMPEPFNNIHGGIRIVRGEAVPIHNGFTAIGAPKRPVVTIGGIAQGSDGKPQYVITGVQAIPSVAPSICKHFEKKKYLEKETVMIVGTVKKLPDGNQTFLIEGLTTINLWLDEPDDEPEDYVCRCMRIYNRWMDIELVEYEEEIIEGVGRRVDNVLVPFIYDLPAINEIVPRSVEVLPMPKKYYKVSCKYEEQVGLLKKVLKSMAEDGYPLASLPNSWMLPHFRVWMEMRCGKVLDDKLRFNYLRKSKNMWNHFQVCHPDVKKPRIPFTKSEIHNLNYDKLEYAKQKVEPIIRNGYREIQTKFVHRHRELWPSMMLYDFPSQAFLDVFYAYGPACETDVFAFRPWNTYENKDLGIIKDRCRVRRRSMYGRK